MSTEEQVVAALKEVVDPHTGISVYDMGLISNIKVAKDAVSLTFRPTSQYCPLGIHLAMNIKRRLLAINKVRSANVTVVGHVREEMINRALQE